MIDDKYYVGFEGEPEVVIYYKEKDMKKNGMKIWIGYFQYLLDASISNTIENGGLVKNYMNQDGWYDESPWKIESLNEAIMELSQFNSESVKSKEKSVVKKLPAIQKELITFLKNAKINNKSVYVNYE
ncbi:TPA: hypothetical protein PTV44_000002 [Clostridium botulinum]|nr:hypothetical protein [Clostridium botulinum]